MSLSQKIFDSDTRPKEKVHCPEWGVDLWVKSLSADEKDRWEIACQKHGETHIRARLLVATVVDEAGNPVWSEGQLGQVGQLSAKPVDRLFAAAIKLNRVSEEDIKELEDFSDATQSDSSSSSSPATSG